jgi:hypothetical protein
LEEIFLPTRGGLTGLPMQAARLGSGLWAREWEIERVDRPVQAQGGPVMVVITVISPISTINGIDELDGAKKDSR